MRTSDDLPVEFSYDPQGPMGLMLAETTPTREDGDPLSILINLEEFLIEQHGMTLIQAVRLGVLAKG